MRPTITPSARANDKSQEPAMLLRIGAVIHTTGLGRSTLYWRMTPGDPSPPVKLSQRAMGWRRTDVQSWTRDRPPGTH